MNAEAKKIRRHEEGTEVAREMISKYPIENLVNAYANSVCAPDFDDFDSGFCAALEDHFKLLGLTHLGPDPL